MLKLECLLDEIIVWIDSNIETNIKIEDVAIRSGYSKWHLQRVFAKSKKINLGTYIRNKKLDSIAKELQNSDSSIISLILAYGFDSQQAFTRAFTRRYNISPGRYRRLHRLSERYEQE